MLFFLEGVRVQAGDTVAPAQRLEELRAGWQERLTRARGSARLLRLVDALFVRPKAQRLLEVTYPSPRGSVERSVQEGILRRLGEDRYGKAYVAEEVLPAVNAPAAGEL